MNLRLARRIAKLTQLQLADKAGVDHSFISLLESGKRDIKVASYAIVMRIASALNRDPQELFDEQTTTKKTRQQQKVKRSA